MDETKKKLGISKISIKGYKSFPNETEISIRPLTILSGANSSGKSSFIQPLLLLKQTLEESYDPGIFLLNGQHVKFNRYEQMFSKIKSENYSQIQFKFETFSGQRLELRYGLNEQKEIQIKETIYSNGKEKVVLRPKMSHNTIIQTNNFIKRAYKQYIIDPKSNKKDQESETQLHTKGEFEYPNSVHY